MRTQSRILAFKVIFADLFIPNNIPKVVNELENEEKFEQKVKDFAKEIYSKYLENKEELSNKITQLTEGYQLDRIFKVDLALLYLAITEILIIQTPKPVVVNEIVEIAKKFSTEKSSAFINGVLAKVE